MYTRWCTVIFTSINSTYVATIQCVLLFHVDVDRVIFSIFFLLKLLIEWNLFVIFRDKKLDFLYVVKWHMTLPTLGAWGTYYGFVWFWVISKLLKSIPLTWKNSVLHSWRRRHGQHPSYQHFNVCVLSVSTPRPSGRRKEQRCSKVVSAWTDRM